MQTLREHGWWLWPVAWLIYIGWIWIIGELPLGATEWVAGSGAG